ncbi:MAG: hypothetical protein HYZ49_15845 [Chloroflexi bacterium]|nr:hypothetical protein [Chloroflexota bacterium]
MADNTPSSSGARFRQIIDKIDEKDGSPQSAPQASAAALEAASAPGAASAQIAAPTTKAATPKSKAEPAKPDRKPLMNDTFKNFAIMFSFVVNLILVVALVVLGLSLFEIKRAIAGPLIGGLHDNFVAMDQAHIETTIPVNTTILVNDTMPVVFDLPLNQNTNVTLSEDTLITGASVTINGGILQLSNAPTTIILPKGTVLPVTLNLTVPVSQTIPVALTVPVNIPVAVDIPLEQTELHQPFSSLRNLFAPYNDVVQQLPDSWLQLFTGSQ